MAAVVHFSGLFQPPAGMQVPLGRRRACPSRALLVICCGAMLAGCGTIDDQRYLPTEEVAQRTLETALTAWQKGSLPPTPVPGASPAIQLVDTQYQPARKLASFKVLGPTTGSSHRCYAVRLTLENPREEVRARFVVWGIDPLWVMRYEDYEMIMHCGHGAHEVPAPENPQGSKTRPGALK